MASASGHININNFDANISASNQQIVEVIEGLEKSIENGVSQEKAINSALYSSFFYPREI